MPKKTPSITKIAYIVPFLNEILHERDRLRTDKGVLQLEKGNLEADVRDAVALIEDRRAMLAHHYIKGDGIEIGAAQFPVRLPSGANVRYVDLFSTEDIRKAWPLYKKVDIVTVDVVDDAEKLTKFSTSSLDFIIANHFLEHCLDPLGTLITMYGKLRRDGIFFFAVPDKRYTFDVKRPVTPFSHLLEEHADTTQKFMRTHTEEFVRLAEGLKGKIARTRVDEFMKSGFRIHYHVWTIQEILEIFEKLRTDFGLKLEIEAVVNCHYEVIIVVRKKA